MGRKELEAARKLAELLELPLTAEEARDGLKIILTEKFPDSQLLPGILLKPQFFLVAGGGGWGRGLLVPFSARSAPCSYPGKFINICLLTYNMNINWCNWNKSFCWDSYKVADHTHSKLSIDYYK